MRGQLQSHTGTRRLNRHYQSGGESALVGGTISLPRVTLHALSTTFTFNTYFKGSTDTLAYTTAPFGGGSLGGCTCTYDIKKSYTEIMQSLQSYRYIDVTIQVTPVDECTETLYLFANYNRVALRGKFALDVVYFTDASATSYAWAWTTTSSTGASEIIYDIQDMGAVYVDTYDDLGPSGGYGLPYPGCSGSYTFTLDKELLGLTGVPYVQPINYAGYTPLIFTFRYADDEKPDSSDTREASLTITFKGRNQ